MFKIIHKKLNFVLIFIFILAILPFINAETINIGDYPITIEQDECWNIPYACDNCSFVNITISYPNGTIIYDNMEMSSVGGFYYNYSFCNTSVLGKYFVVFHYDEDGSYLGSDMNWFRVTPNGEILSSGVACLYLGFIGILLIFLIISIIGIFKAEHYIGKFTLYWVSHLLFIAISFIGWNVTSNFLLTYSFVTGMFKIMFYFSLIATFPMVLLSLVWVFWIHMMTEEIRSMMDKGMNSEEAWDRANKSGRSWFKW